MQASKVAENVVLLWTAYHCLPCLCVPVYVCVCLWLCLCLINCIYGHVCIICGVHEHMCWCMSLCV